MTKTNDYCPNTDRAFSSISLGDYIKVFRNKHWMIGVVTRICPIQRHVRWLHNDKSGYAIDGHFQFLSDDEISKVKSSRPARDDDLDEAMQDLSKLVTRMLRIHSSDTNQTFEESAAALFSSIKQQHTRQPREASFNKREK